MAAITDKERVKQALQTLDEARGELTSEARWLKHELSPRAVAHRMVDRHTVGLLVSSLGAGLALAWLIFHDRKAPRLTSAHRRNHSEEKPEKKAGVMRMLMKAAVPVALKAATSGPVMERVTGFIRDVHRARPSMK